MSVFDRFRLDGKKMLITGGSRGLGREMVLAIAEAGAHVVCAARTQAQIDETVAEIAAAGEATGRRSMVRSRPSARVKRACTAVACVARITLTRCPAARR